jgi:putative tricarboxylic transport membrane protein
MSNLILFEAIFAGTILGIISGLIPGVGNFVLMLLIFPFLGNFNVYELIVLYTSMAAISQYIGSIPATLYSIPGESSSYPTVIESKNLTTLDQVSNAISGSAFGSFFGSILVLGLCYFLADSAHLVSYFYSTKLIVCLLLLVSFAVCAVAGHSWIVNTSLLLGGFALGAIGYNEHFSAPILTFGNMYLYAGLPLEVVLICLFAIPQILQNFNVDAVSPKLLEYKLTKIYFINPVQTLFYTVVGFFGGLVPGLTTVFSSIAAYNISSWLTKDPVKRIVASETANNAGAFSMLLPLLLFGVPLIGSEALLLSLIEQRGFIISSINFSELISTLSMNVVIVNLLGLLLAWPLSKQVKHFYRLNLKVVFSIVLVLLFAVVTYSGYINYSFTYYLLVFAMLAPIGYALRNVNTLPLVFAFIIHDKLFDGVVRAIHLL